MACGNACNKKKTVTSTVEVCPNRGSNNAYIIMIVLYILLAIIVGSCLL